MLTPYFKDKKILIIGGTGTIGQGLVEELLKCSPKVIRIFSRDEYKQHIMQQRFSEYINQIRYLIGDIRDSERVLRAMSGIDVVFNLAAMKHVPACEYNPFEAVKTNVIGLQNVIEAAIENRVDRVIFTSSDKAINPSNAYGATKLLGERVIMAAHNYRGQANTIFASVRFGNVMGSRGSVIPLFINQIREKGCITVTDPEMTRFMMSLSQAVALTLKAAVEAQGGETRILKMPVLKLGDLSEVVIRMFNEKNGWNRLVEQQIIGLRSGEKLYEELMTEDEANFAIEDEDMFVLYPPESYLRFDKEGARKADAHSYSSHQIRPLTPLQIESLLRTEQLI